MPPLTELLQVHLANDYPLLPVLHCQRYTPPTQHESIIINVKNMFIDSHKYYRVNKKNMYNKNVFNAMK